MKLKIILLLLVAAKLYSQEVTQIEYISAFKLADDESVKSPKQIANLSYTLVFNHKQSIFKKIKRLGLDQQVKNRRLISMADIKGVYYKNSQDKTNILITKQDGKRYLIDKSKSNWNWEILKETKQILGYKCYKALGTRKEYNYVLKKDRTLKAIVWFTPKIPLPFGPADFGGLPGLVLESQRGSFYIIAKKIKHKSSNKALKIDLDKGIKLTDEEFARKQYAAFMDRIRQ